MPPKQVGIIGYGKMGKAVEDAARQRGYDVLVISNNQNPIPPTAPDRLMGWIDFSTASAVERSIEWALHTQKPLVIGTTGWYDRLEDFRYRVLNGKGKVLWSANFDWMMQIMFILADIASRLIHQSFLQPSIRIHEVHHVSKKDAPSGTALHLMRLIQHHFPDLPAFQIREDTTPTPLEKASDPMLPMITYRREKDIFGTHCLQFNTSNATLAIKHVARNRQGFANGALDALEWLTQQAPGFYSIDDYIQHHWMNPAGIILQNTSL